MREVVRLEKLDARFVTSPSAATFTILHNLRVDSSDMDALEDTPVETGGVAEPALGQGLKAGGAPSESRASEEEVSEDVAASIS